jgi:hypothetical protein
LNLKLKKRYFPALLKSPNIADKEKKKIEKLLSRKFTPYTLRHSSLQIYARSGISEYDLRLHAGWNKTSDMIEVYTTESGGESAEDILRMTYKIETKDQKQIQQIQEQEKGRTCQYCGIQNLQSAQTCIECGKVIDPIKLGIIVEEAERTQTELQELRKKQQETERSKFEIEKLKDGQVAMEKTMSSLMKVILGQSDTITADWGDIQYLDPETQKWVGEQQGTKQKKRK